MSLKPHSHLNKALRYLCSGLQLAAQYASNQPGTCFGVQTPCATVAHIHNTMLRYFENCSSLENKNDSLAVYDSLRGAMVLMQYGVNLTRRSQT